jgi:hypothetical protein
MTFKFKEGDRVIADPDAENYEGTLGILRVYPDFREGVYVRGCFRVGGVDHVTVSTKTGANHKFYDWRFLLDKSNTINITLEDSLFED